MKIIDGKDTILGRLASFAAKESLKGEEIVILNCEKIKITGNRKSIKEDFEKKRKRVGSGQRGPKISRSSEKIVKRAIRGMLPEHREGRGRLAYKRIKCYIGIPKQFQDAEKIMIEIQKPKKIKKNKFIMIEELSKKQ